MVFGKRQKLGMLEHINWFLGRGINWECWSILMMRTVPFLFFKSQKVSWGREIIFGYRDYSKNPFQCHAVILNLTSSINYNPVLPLVNKLRTGGNTSNEIFIYINNVWVMGGYKEECWKETRTFAEKFKYIGIQDAPRKWKIVDQSQGRWVG